MHPTIILTDEQLDKFEEATRISDIIKQPEQLFPIFGAMVGITDSTPSDIIQSLLIEVRELRLLKTNLHEWCDKETGEEVRVDIKCKNCSSHIDGTISLMPQWVGSCYNPKNPHYWPGV